MRFVLSVVGYATFFLLVRFFPVNWFVSLSDTTKLMLLPVGAVAAFFFFITCVCLPISFLLDLLD